MKEKSFRGSESRVASSTPRPNTLRRTNKASTSTTTLRGLNHTLLLTVKQAVQCDDLIEGK